MTNHKKHIMMWGELAETGSAEKRSTEAYKMYPTFPACYACDESGGICEFCPIIWIVDSPGDMSCHNYPSPYSKWHTAKTIKTRKKYAAIIRDLEWRQL